MGIEYRVILTDEFDWDYKDYSRNRLENEIRDILPSAKIITSVDNLVIFDIGRNLPHVFKNNYNIVYDGLYYQSDEGGGYRKILEV